MKDRELLSWAAKAAAIEYSSTEDQGLSLASGKYWNPLEDDGDALRLAVMCLPFHILQYTAEDYEYCNQDGFAATRRAIVRKAAEIGKDTK